MNGSADEAKVTPETPKGSTEAEPIAPRQLREFDAKVVQHLPDLSKEEMQHLIEHPEELRVRLRYFGLSMESFSPSAFRDDIIRSKRWSDFYADVFEVSADFSRVRLSDMHLYTHATPIFVAPRLELAKVVAAFQKLDVNARTPVYGRVPVVDVCNSEMVDVGRPSENYIASFSPKIIEGVPGTIRDTWRYRAAHMTLRECLLWILSALYRWKRSGGDFPYEDIPAKEFGEVSRLCFGTMLPGGDQGASIRVAVRKRGAAIDVVIDNDRALVDRHYTHECFGVSRVKLWTALPQV